MTDEPKGLAKLREPFPPNQINVKPQPYSKDARKGDCKECGSFHGLPALHLDYVGHAAVTARLLDVDPYWLWEPMGVDQFGLPMLDKNGGLWIRLTVLGVTRIGYGDAQGKAGGNAIKEAIGDAIRNAGIRFGIALDLWHKGDLYDVSDEPTPEGEPTPKELADNARSELLKLLTDNNLSTEDAVSRFAADGYGNLGQSTNVEALRGLIAHYRAQVGGES